ncbi:MAG: SUMF1/EgtB/PvdO family nonheme iron enzyme [Candidatus Micrarchaeia archaeon]
MKASAAMLALPMAAGLMLSCREAETSPSSYDMASSDVSVARKMPRPPRPAPAPASTRFTNGYTAGCPQWMVRASTSGYDYCIDRFEAYLTVKKGGKEVLHPHAQIPPKEGITARVSPDEYPQSSISQVQATLACENAGKRLCTLLEWKQACMGVEQFTYPYGNAEKTNKCNNNKIHLLSILHGNDNTKWDKSDMNDPLLNMMEGFLEKPGKYSECVSSFGTYDMVGNLHEWVSDLVTKEMVGSMPRLDKKAGEKGVLFAAPGNGIFMGGFVGSANQNGKGCNYATIAHGIYHYDYSTGFRCCSEVGSK